MHSPPFCHVPQRRFCLFVSITILSSMAELSHSWRAEKSAGTPNLTAPTPHTADGKPDLSGCWGNYCESQGKTVVCAPEFAVPRRDLGWRRERRWRSGCRRRRCKAQLMDFLANALPQTGFLRWMVKRRFGTKLTVLRRKRFPNGKRGLMLNRNSDYAYGKHQHACSGMAGASPTRAFNRPPMPGNVLVSRRGAVSDSALAAVQGGAECRPLDAADPPLHAALPSDHSGRLVRPTKLTAIFVLIMALARRDSGLSKDLNTPSFLACSLSSPRPDHKTWRPPAL